MQQILEMLMQSTLFREKVLKRFHFHNLFNLNRSIPNKSLIQSVQVDLTANDEGGLLPTEKLCLRLNSFLAPADAFQPCQSTLQQCCWQCPAGRVFQYRVGSGIGQKPGSGSCSGRVGVSKFTIGYFRVSFLLSGISSYFRVCRVFSGISGFTHIY